MNQEILNDTRKKYRALKKQGISNCQAMRIALESVPDTYGMESLGMKYSESTLYYANTGEIYNTTVLAWHNWRTKRTVFGLGNWGDLVESGRYFV